MKPDKIPTEPTQEPEEDVVAEKHVIEIMGPADRLDGSRDPELPTSFEPKKPEQAAVPEAQPTPTTAPEVAEEAQVETPPEIDSAVTVPTAPAEVPEDATEDASSALPDPQLDKVVDDIVKDDAEKLLPPENDDDTPPVVMKSSMDERIRQLYFKWWDNKIARYSTLGVLVALLAVIAFVPVVRATTLNLLGVRTSISVTAIDGSTALPLKNVVLKVGSGQVKTNDDGYAKLYGIKLGKQEVVLQKAGFATTKRSLSLGMRTVDLGDVSLKAVGTQYTFVLSDYFSGKPVSEVALSSGEATTSSDKTGKAVLTVQPSDDAKVSVTIEKSGYRTEKLAIAADATSPTTLKLVPAQKEVFVTKESGKYDLYKMDLDGTHKEVLLAGTGLETPAISVLADPSGERVALVSTRDDKRNSDGYLLSALTIVNVETGDSEVIEHAEQITLLGWSGTTILYQQTVAGVSAANANRQKIMAYDYNASKRIQVANANYFSGAVLIGDKVYYVISATDPNVQGSFVRSNIDATNKKTLHTGELWQLYRADYKTLRLQTPTNWYEYKIGNTSVSSTNPPTTYATHKFVDSTDGKLSAWVDDRDANGALMVYNVADGKNTQRTVQKGMADVIRWVSNDVVIFRTVSSNEIVEYAVSVTGGEPHRLSAVSAVY